MTPRISIALALVTFGLGLACVTPAPPQELVDARRAYGDATVDAAAGAPTELRTAKAALEDAEAAYAEDPRSPDVADRAYIAERESQLASAKARAFKERNRLEANNARLRLLSASAATQLRATREQLEAAEQRARAADQSATQQQSSVQQLQTQLEDTRSAIESQAGELESAKQTLEQERAARREAESRMTTMLQGIDDLKSVKQEARGLVITLSGQVLFPSGQWMLLPAARAALDNVAEALKGSPDRKIVVEGYTDAQGSGASNLVLSQARAEAVRKYLVSRGVNEDQITARGYGEEAPVAPNTSAEGRANNRRVEIVVSPAPAAEPR